MKDNQMTEQKALWMIKALDHKKLKLREWLRSNSSPLKAIKIDNLAAIDVLQIVSDVFNIPVYRIIGKDRKHETVLARKIAMHVMRNELNWSYVDIGKAVERDHTTAIYACRTIDEIIEMNKKHGVDKPIIDKLDETKQRISEAINFQVTEKS